MAYFVLCVLCIPVLFIPQLKVNLHTNDFSLVPI